MNKTYLLLSLVLFLPACGFTGIGIEKEPKVAHTEIEARITFYHAFQCRWGDQVACPRTPKAREGITVAAHRSIPFGTEIKIPELKGKIGDGKFVVQDRGGAVNRKTASGGRFPVFDVFVYAPNRSAANQRLRELMRNKPDYMQVLIKEEI